MDDPLMVPGLSSIARVRAEARASLKNPSRPFTPRSSSRPLFSYDFPTHTDDERNSDEKKNYEKNSDESDEKQLDYFENQEEEDAPYTKFITALQQSKLDENEHITSICTNMNEYVMSLQQSSLDNNSAIPTLINFANALQSLLEHKRGNDFLTISTLQVLLTLYSNLSRGDTKKSLETLVSSSCKILFDLSTTAHNDDLFISNPAVIEAITRLFEMTNQALKFNTQALVYAAGALKNVSSNSEEVQNFFGSYGVISTISRVVNHEFKNSDDNDHKSLLIQLTGILRNLSVNKKHHKQFYGCKVIPRLGQLLEHPDDNIELMLNINRILCKLTLHEAARKQFATLENIQNLVEMISVVTEEKVLLRAFFTIGNLSSSNDKIRRWIHKKLDGISVFTTHLFNFTNKLLKENDDVTIDVLVKLTRVIANLSINESIGQDLATKTKTSKDVLHVLISLAQVVVDEEELLLNVCSCLTNITYYCKEDTYDNILASDQFIKTVLACLLHPNEEAVYEGCRILGNVSRLPTVLSAIQDSTVTNVLVLLLNHTCVDIVYTVCGTLMNVVSHNELRSSFIKDQDGFNKLLEVLRSAGLSQVSLSEIVCKVLCNILTFEKFDDAGAVKCLRILDNTLEELLHACSDSEEEDVLAFVSVANALREQLRR